MRQTSIYAGVLVVICLAVFAPAYRAAITNWDDVSYLAAPVTQRVSPAILTAFVLGNYHPLTVFSFAVEQQWFGPDPIVLHVTNVVLHAIAAVLLLIWLRQLAGSAAAAFAGALLWAVHPLRVESVVWIAERKDVLCGVFYFAALIAYTGDLRNHRRRMLGLSLLLFALALLSKVMAVSFPLAILAVDFVERRPINREALIEKIPFFALSVLFGLIGAAHQQVVPSLPRFSPLERIALSCRVLLFYLEKIVLPLHLSAFYPYPRTLTAADWISPLLVAVIAALVVLTLRATRAIAFAFIVFLVTIVIVLPVLPLGRTIAGDRFTYVPSIGFAYAIAVLVRYAPKVIIAVLVAAAALGTAAGARSQVWHDSIALWTSVIDAGPPLAQPLNARAAALADAGQIGAAIRDLNRALELEPCYATALQNRAKVAARLGDRASAERDLAQLRRCARAPER